MKKVSKHYDLIILFKKSNNIFNYKKLKQSRKIIKIIQLPRIAQVRLHAFSLDFL